jgi:hypothetical protein
MRVDNVIRKIKSIVEEKRNVWRFSRQERNCKSQKGIWW